MYIPTAMRRALELVTGENVTNFKAQNAKAIVEHLCPCFGVIYMITVQGMAVDC